MLLQPINSRFRKDQIEKNRYQLQQEADSFNISANIICLILMLQKNWNVFSEII